MPEPHLERLQQVLRGLAAGADPSRLLHEALQGALLAANAREGVVVRNANGEISAVASTGQVSDLLRDAAESAVTSQRLVRKRGEGSADVAAAEPLRVGGRVIGALAVLGTMERLDPGNLPLYGDAAALVLARRPAAAGVASVEVVDVLSRIGSSLETPAVLASIFDAAGTMFGVSAGFCALFEGSSMRIAHYRGIDHERLVTVARLPEFKAMLQATEVTVDGGSHPVVSQIARLGEVAVGIPLTTEGRRLGHLVLLLGDKPDPARRALLAAFARHAATVLRSAQLLQQIADHEEQLTATVHSMANPVVVVDEESRVIEVNGAASEVLRLASNFETGHPVNGRLGSPQLEAMLSSGNDGSAEVVLGAEEPRVYRATVRRVRSTTGRMMGRILVLDDLTSERQLEAVKADFVAVMGHELRTPLTVMKGYVHTLVRRWDTLSEDRRGQALDALQSNLLRLERLIEDLLFVSAIEQRRCKVDLNLVDLGMVLEAYDSERVRVRRPRRPVEIEIDQPKVEQVVHHLVDNALKYSEGQIVLELFDKGDVVEISVTDSGPGIYSGDIPFLFERFRQLDGSSTRAHGGVGIGLYICKRIVEALGGRIWCDSRLGVGSRFVFTLPRDVVTHEEASPRSAALA